MGVGLLGPRRDVGIRHSGKSALGLYPLLRATARAVKEINQSIHLRVEFLYIPSHLRIFFASGRHQSLVGIVVVHKSEVLPPDEARILQQLQAGVLIPPPSVCLAVHIPARTLLHAREVMHILDVELAHEARMVVGPCRLGNLVVGAKIIVEIDGRNIAVLVRHIHHALYATRHTVQTAAENQVVRIRGAYGFRHHTVVPLRQIGGIRLFLCLRGGGQIHAVARRPYNSAVVRRVACGKRGNDQIQLFDIERQLVVRKVAQQVALVAVLRKVTLRLCLTEGLKLRVEHQQVIGGFVLHLLRRVIVVLPHLPIRSIEVVSPGVGHLPVVPQVVAVLGLRLGGDEVPRAVKSVAAQHIVVVLERGGIEACHRPVDTRIAVGVYQPPASVYLRHVVEPRRVRTQIGARSRSGIVGRDALGGGIAVERLHYRDGVAAPPAVIRTLGIEGRRRECPCRHAHQQRRSYLSIHINS